MLGAFGAALIQWALASHEGVGTRLMVWFPFVFLVLLVLYFRYLERKMAGPLLAAASQRELAMTFELDNSGYAARSDVSSSQGAWSTLTGHRETSTSFLLFSARGGYVVLPKRAFREEDLPAIRQLLRTHIHYRQDQAALKRVLLAWALLVLAFGGIWWFFRDTAKSSEHPGHGASPRASSSRITGNPPPLADRGRAAAGSRP